VEVTESVMNKLPGFVSAKLHKSLDGTRVVNNAQWRSREEFEAMLDNPEAAVHMKEAEKMAQEIGPRLYEVSFIERGPASLTGPGPQSASKQKTTPGEASLGAVPF
jgi:heme-degrading monooxygenase HmoA